MTDQKTGGWLSSVVGNISGFWSRSPNDSSATSRRSSGIRDSPRNISYEEQAESDVAEEDDGIIIESESAGPSVTLPTTSRAQTDVTPRRRAFPSSVLSVTARSLTSSDNQTLPNAGVNRKRPATSSLFQDDFVGPGIADTSNLSSATEPLWGGFLTKRSRLLRDFTDERPFLSPSLFDTAAERSLNQSFASSFSPLNLSVIKTNVSRPHSTVSSSLSTKTRAILEQLEKINAPVKEVKRLSSYSLNEPERWASDALGSPVQKPARNSMCALSRAQLISNLLETKPTSPFWGRPAHPTKITDKVTVPSAEQLTESSAPEKERGRGPDKVLPAKSMSFPLPKTADLVTSSRKAEPGETSADVGTKQPTPLKAVPPPVPTASVKANAVVPPPSSSVKTTNVFSARLPELELVSPVKEKTKNDKEKEVMTIDSSMFPFAPPITRGPSVNVRREGVPEKKTRLSPPSSAADGSAITVSKITAQKAPDAVLSSASKQSEDQSDITSRAEEPQPLVDKRSLAKPVGSGSTTLDTMPVKSLLLQKTADKWTCPDCMVFNNMNLSKCVCCGYENKRVEAKPWTCSECWVSNKANDDKCIACGNAKQSKDKSVKSAESAANVFGDRTFKPTAISKDVSFGFPAAKPATAVSLPASTPAAAEAGTDISSSGTVVNGNATKGVVLKFGLTSSASAPNFGFGKPLETSAPLPTILEAPASSQAPAPAPALSFGVPSTSAATAPLVPPLTGPQLSFPTLATTTTSVAATTTAIATGSTFSFPISTTANPFAFGSSTSITAGLTKAPTAPLFTFGSSAPPVAVTTTAATAVTTAAPLPSFGTTFPTLPAFSTPKAPLFGTNGGSAASTESHDVIEMSSPTTSPITSSVADGPFGMAKPAAPLFSFGASNVPSSTSSTGGFFGNLQTTTQNPLTTPSTSLFSFGQQPQNAPKPFEPPASLTSPPTTFNFGGTTSNGGSGFVFGSTAPPANFAFGAQQPASSAASTTFNFAPVVPAPTFGATPGSAPNFFSVGSTSTTARKMLKARRTRK